MEIKYKNLFGNNAKAIKPLNLKIQNLLKENQNQSQNNNDTVLPKTALRTINEPTMK